MTNVSATLVSSSKINAPVSKMTACTAINRPWPIKRRTFSTSSVARIINWPVRFLS